MIHQEFTNRLNPIWVILVILALPGCDERTAGKSNEPISIGDILRGDAAQAFVQVDKPREFVFSRRPWSPR